MRTATLLLLLAACPKTPSGPSPEERAESQKLLAPALAHAAELAAERKKALVESRLVPRPELGACPIDARVPDPRRKPAGFDLDRMKRELAAVERVSLLPVKPEELGNSPLYHAFQSRVSGLSNQPPAKVRAALADLGDSFWDYDVVVVEEARTDAQRAVAGYVAGQFRGRAILWSFKDHKILCMADVESTSSSKVTVTETVVGGKKVGDNFQTAAGVDLLENVLRDAMSRLVLAGPPK
jgi:hypothetical protein